MNLSIKNKTLCIVHCALCIVMLTACRPKEILSPKAMEDIMVDLHTSEGILQVAGYNYGHDEEYRGYCLVILERHGTTQAQFDSSLVWYTAKPTIFNKIYPKVLDRLQAQYDAYAALMESKKTVYRRTVSEWTQLCQQGYDKGPWQKKNEKNAQKFVYVKKM